jgi:RHS repeat-associated protein
MHRSLAGLLIAASILAAVPAMAICEAGTVKPQVTLEYLGPDDFGHGAVKSTYTFPNTDNPSQRGLSLYLDGHFFVDHPAPQLTAPWDFSLDVTCWATGPHVLEVHANACGRTDENSSTIAATSVTVSSTPEVNLSLAGPDLFGQVLATVHYHFPNTDESADRGGGLTSDFGFSASFAADQLEDDWPVAIDMSCRPSATYTLTATANACRKNETGFVDSDTKAITVNTKASVSLSYSEQLGVVVHYAFPGTKSPAQRGLSLEVDGASFQPIPPFGQSGEWQPPVGTCWKKLRVVATPCGNSADSDEDQLENPKQLEDAISVALLKTGETGTPPKPTIQATVSWNALTPQTTIHLKLQNWTDGNGTSNPGYELQTFDSGNGTGTALHSFNADSEARHVVVAATGTTPCGIATGDDDITCAICENNSTTADPVYLTDGNMRLTDGEPLPPIAGHGLARTYDSEEGVGGLFGRGWTSLFERRLVAHTDGAISIVTETNEVVTFRAGAGVFRQTWPRAANALGTLTYDSSAAAYAYRAAGSTELAIFRASDGRLVELRDAARATDAVITYGGQGRPIAFTDTITEVAWMLTVNAQRRIDSIVVAGHPELAWTYSYDVDGHLETVLAPSSAPWRTYEYEAGRMTASRDAAGNLIESHSYDGQGYAITSTGNVDEIEGIEYNLPGTVAGERMTRVTYKTGAVAEYSLRAIGGAWRPVQVTGGCSSCGADDATYVRDVRGRVVREQGADGYVIVRVYSGDDLVSEEMSLKPAGCDPQTDAQRCRLDSDALSTAALETTDATVRTFYEHGDALWPDKVTAVIRPSVLSPSESVREARTYHPVTGAVVTTSVTGWSGSVPALVTHTTQTAFYDADLAPVFTPGGTFQAAWLSLPQPSGVAKSIDGPRTDLQDITAFVYYPIDASVPALLRGRIAAMKDAAGLITHYDQYDVFGNVLRIVDSNGVAAERTYDPLGRPATTTTKGISGCNASLDPLCATDLTATQTYSPSSGPLLRAERPGGGVTSYTYDGRGRVQTISRGPATSDLRERIETSYDVLTGKKSLERTLAYESGAWVEKTRESYFYDDRSRLQAVTHADDAAVHYTYDAKNRIASVRDENHSSANTRYAYDPAGRVAVVTQSLASAPGGVMTTHYTYDSAGDLTAVTDPNGNVTTYVYDDFGQMLSQHSPVTGTVTYAYDSAGNLTHTTDANGATTSRTYDSMNRVLTAVSARGDQTETVSWTYDSSSAGAYGMGRLAAMEDPSGVTSYAYERRGLLRDEAHTILGSTYLQTYGYDANGHRTSIGYPSGRVVTYSFDDAGRPLTATGTLAAQTTSYVTSAAYLPFGPMKSMTLGNGTIETRTYNARYSPLTSSVTAGAATIAQYTYTTDPAGNITSIADGNGAVYKRTFGYDDLNRLTTANTGSALWGTGSFTYDRMGNMLTAVLGATTRTFTHQGTTPKISMATGLTGAMAYDAAGNELKSPAGDPDGGEMPASYSPRNLLQSQFVRQYDRCIEQFGSPCILPEPVQEWLTNMYDGRGIRVATIDVLVSDNINSNPPVEHLYFYTPELSMLNIVSRSTGRTADVIWFGSRPVADHSATTVRYTFTDHLGTPILQTSSTAAVVWRAEYEPFGNLYQLRAGTAADDQPLRFPGQQVAYSTVAGEENYNIFRWYRSGWGRYTQSDPIGYFVRENTFGYARGNSLRFTDRLGLFSIDESCKNCTPGFSPSQYQQEVTGWCANIDKEVNDVALADCIKTKCQTGVIRCDDPDNLCHKNYGAYGPYGGSYVNVCLNNAPSKGGMPTGTAGAQIIHEFAHNCNWKHGQQKGNSPCQDGTFGCIPSDLYPKNDAGWDY